MTPTVTPSSTTEYAASIRNDLLASGQIRPQTAPKFEAQCLLDHAGLEFAAKHIVRHHSAAEARAIATHDSVDSRVGELVLAYLQNDVWNTAGSWV